MPYQPKILHRVFPTSKAVVLHNLNRTIKIRKLTVMHYYHLILRPHSGFTRCPITVLYSKRIQFRAHTLSLVSFSLEQFFNLLFLTLKKLFLTFVTLPLLKITGQFFFRISLCWGLSVSSWLDSDYASLAGIAKGGSVYCIPLSGWFFIFMMFTFIM